MLIYTIQSGKGRINGLMAIKLNDIDMFNKVWLQEWIMGYNAHHIIFRLCISVYLY